MLQMLFFSHAQRICISTALVELILETLCLFYKEVESYLTLSYPSLREFWGKLDLAQILSVDD